MIDPSEGVRRALNEYTGRLPGVPLLIGCSGGPDSLALVHLALQARDEAALAPIHVGVVDHQLQPGSAQVAQRAIEAAKSLGADECHLLTVTVDIHGQGIEAAARSARREALAECARRIGAFEVWLGHTLDDQAETVLLGLARGSGARSLAGMPDNDGMWARPLLRSRRTDVHACLPADTAAWADPHNEDPRFLRPRVRHDLMPVLEAVLGERAVEGLARTADLLRADDIALRRMAATFAGEVLIEATDNQVVFDRSSLRGGPSALRQRVLREALVRLGSPASELTSRHYARIDAALGGRGTVGPLAMPGAVEVLAESDRLTVRKQHGHS
ncbi:MAG: tRNA lysidine(34) synthetase TilS [Actinobacteria bacterium]|nr:tRNA lysidine(34) synthetase TilS [Actinomycetota bacterium]